MGFRFLLWEWEIVYMFVRHNQYVRRKDKHTCLFKLIKPFIDHYHGGNTLDSKFGKPEGLDSDFEGNLDMQFL